MFSIYEEISPTSERWIYINCQYYDESDEFGIFVREYASQLDGKIFAVSDQTQYGIDNDPLNLILQWDSCFGITVIVPYETDLSAAMEAMQKHCDIVNKKVGDSNVFEYNKRDMEEKGIKNG